MTQSTTMADVIVARLRAAGVRALFGVPGGGGNLDLVDAAGRAGLPFVLTTTETGGALAAMAQAEITGRPGACLTTLGPGAASVVNGVACAWLDRAPVIVFTDSQPGPSEHQRLDHAALLGSVVKSSASLTVETGVESLDRLIGLATTGRPGPVHVDCPGGVLDVRRAVWSEDRRTHAAAYTPGRPTYADDSRLASLLSASRKPMLIVGLGARRREDADAIRSLCVERGVPAMVTYKAKGVVPDDHEWFAGVFTNGAVERALVDESDLLIGLGFDPVELLPRPWTHRAPLVSLGPWMTMTDERHVPCEFQWVTDIPTAVDHIRHGLTSSDWDSRHVRENVEAQQGAINVPAAGMTAQDVVRIAAATLAPTYRVTVDAGAHMLPATMLWPVGDPNGMLISNGLSTMGFALPAAIGAALADPARPVVAFTGDGGLLMCAGELLTAARENLRIVVIVFNDASLSLIEIKQHARKLPPAGVALGSVDWAALARSMGVAGFTASTEAELDVAIDRAVDGGGPALIDARIDNSNYSAMLRAVRG